jgi:DnaJ-class molecular chaperone
VILASVEEETGDTDKTTSFSVPDGPITNPMSIKRPHFQRLKTRDDLVMEVSIHLQEALLGFRLALRHLDDRIIIVESPSQEVLQSQSILTVKNEGMPLEHDPSRHGDLIIKISVIMPTVREIRSLKPDQVAALKTILPPPMHNDSNVDAVIGKKFLSTLPEVEESEYEVTPVRASVYDPKIHAYKQRQRYSDAQSAKDAEDKNDENSKAEEPAGAPQCKQM